MTYILTIVYCKQTISEYKQHIMLILLLLRDIKLFRVDLKWQQLLIQVVPPLHW